MKYSNNENEASLAADSRRIDRYLEWQFVVI